VQKAAGKTWHLVTDEIQRAVGLLYFTWRLETSTYAFSTQAYAQASIQNGRAKA
jgi:hypothetical protein